MIQAVGHVSNYIDPEYMRILAELRKLGITPSGNKIVDRQKLVQEKQKFEENLESSNYIERNTEREKLEEERKGATALADINKILLGL